VGTGEADERDRVFMREAVELSRRKMQEGCGGPFGALVVSDGRVVGRGWNAVTSTNDPTAHAEIVAIREACRELGVFHLDGAVLYASCEPCPMCLAAAYWARVARICYGGTRQDAAEAGFADAHIYREMSLDPGERRIPMVSVMRDEALDAFRAWTQKDDRIAY
jgi:tRNA(Arg) A34 adenosine deaminase TadA